MKRLCATLLLGALVACNGGNGTPTTPPTPAPTPVPVTYNGTYTGTSMRFTGGGLVAASTTASHNGSNLSFDEMEITGIGTFEMGRATLTGNTFDGTNRYRSSGCGIVNNHYSGWFSGSGDLMNMTCMLSSDSCADLGLRGEMRRGTAASRVPKTSTPDSDAWPWSPVS